MVQILEKITQPRSGDLPQVGQYIHIQEFISSDYESRLFR